MTKVYIIEWFYLRRIIDKSEYFKLCIGLRKGKRVLRYLVYFRSELCADVLCCGIPRERNEKMTEIVRTIFKEHHLSSPVVEFSNSYTYRRRSKRQSYLMKHYLDDYITV